MVADNVVIDNEILNQLAQGVFQTMLEIELFPGEVEVEGTRLVATIQIAGAWSGEVSLAFTTDLARNAASRMLKLAAEDVTTIDEHEVAAELANMIGGNFKSLLPSPSQLSLPIIGTVPRILPSTQVVTLMSQEGGLQLAVNGGTA
jgi:chemotaxis protein CheX